MSGQDDFVSALYATVLAGTGQAAGGASGQSYFCLEWPSLPIEPADFANALSGENPEGSPAALEAFSTLVDEVPALSPLYQETGVSLQSVYAMILEATVAGGSAVARVFASAKEQFDLLVRGSVTDPLAVYHPAYAQPRTWADPAGLAQWVTVQIGAGVPPPPLPPVLHPVFDEGLNKLSWRFTNQSPPIIIRPKPSEALLAARTDLLHAAPGATVASRTAAATAVGAEQVHPATWAMIPALVARPPSALTASRLAGTTLRPSVVAPGGMMPTSLSPELAQRFGAMRIVPQGPPVTPPEEQPAKSSNLRATLQMLHIGIKRPWYDPTVLHLPGWSLDGISRGFFSNGKPDVDPGLCPLVPTSVIAVRNVRIAGTWSPVDQAAAGRAMGNAKQASFGPFTLATAGRAQASFDGSTLSIPGIHIVAWICSRMPILPP